jgi:hypothetical protein
MSFLREEGVAGEGRARGIKQLTSSKGPEKMGIHHHEQGTAIPSKGIFFFLSLK